MRIYWSFYRFKRYFGHFLGFGVILFIFRFRGYFDHFLGLGDISVILSFRGILVIF